MYTFNSRNGNVLKSFFPIIGFEYLVLSKREPESQSEINLQVLFIS